MWRCCVLMFDMVISFGKTSDFLVNRMEDRVDGNIRQLHTGMEECFAGNVMCICRPMCTGGGGNMFVVGYEECELFVFAVNMMFKAVDLQLPLLLPLLLSLILPLLPPLLLSLILPLLPPLLLSLILPLLPPLLLLYQLQLSTIVVSSSTISGGSTQAMLERPSSAFMDAVQGSNGLPDGERSWSDSTGDSDAGGEVSVVGQAPLKYVPGAVGMEVNSSQRRESGDCNSALSWEASLHNSSIS